jgi:hypothetical protein
MVRRSASTAEMERVSELADWDRSALGRARRRASILLARRCPVRQSPVQKLWILFWFGRANSGRCRNGRQQRVILKRERTIPVRLVRRRARDGPM